MEYYVIEFGQPPPEYTNKYACVPHTWVLAHDNNKIVFRYPNERVSIAMKRIVKGENVSEEWPIYLEAVNYRSEYFAFARDCAKTLEKYYRQKCDAKKSPETSKHSKSKPADGATPKMQNSNRKCDTSKDNSVNQDVNDSTMADVTMTPNEVQSLCASVQALVKEMKQQNNCIDKLNLEFNEIRKVSLSNVASLKEMESKISMIESGRENSNDAGVGISSQAQNKTAESESESRVSEPEYLSEPESDSDWESDSESKRGKRRRRRALYKAESSAAPKRKFTQHISLPPEYDANDSKWTLRYPAMAPGLEELEEGTGVYVDSVRFANCKEIGKTHNEFARLLLLEIFSMNALRVCSLTGAKRNGLVGAAVRPGLDENARNVLVNFVLDKFKISKSYYNTRDLDRVLADKLQHIRKTQG